MSGSTFTAYVACLAGSEINVFEGDSDGRALTSIQTVELSGKGLPLATAPDRRHLYASVIGERDGVEEDRIDAFEIIPGSGRLVPLSSTVVMARMAHISVDRSGGWLLGASFPSSLIAVYPIGSRGQVQSVPSFSMPTPKKAHQILTDHSNRFAFVPNLGADLVMQLRFDADRGVLVENAPPLVHLQSGAGCRHIAFHPNRRYVYLLNELDGSLVVYELDSATGTLSEIGRDSILRPDLEGDPWGAQILVSPDGYRLFASERRGRTLAAWNIDPNSGEISNRQIIETGGNPRCFDIVPNGRLLILAAMDDDEITVYDIADPASKPTPISSAATGHQPAWVEIVQP